MVLNLLLLRHFGFQLPFSSTKKKQAHLSPSLLLKSKENDVWQHWRVCCHFCNSMEVNTKWAENLKHHINMPLKKWAIVWQNSTPLGIAVEVPNFMCGTELCFTPGFVSLVVQCSLKDHGSSLPFRIPVITYQNIWLLLLCCCETPFLDCMCLVNCFYGLAGLPFGMVDFYPSWQCWVITSNSYLFHRL